MELRHLRQFVAVAEEQHVTRAAERLGMQQPPLSQRINAIEHELGVQLFHRRARGVALTEAGRVLFENARAMLAQYDRTFEATKRAARGEQGRIAVGVNPTAPFHPVVPSIIREFRAAFPLVALTLDECLRAEAIDALRNGQMDVAFVRSAAAEKDLASHAMLTEPMVMALPAAHPLARRKGALNLRDFANETFIFYARKLGPALYEATLAACLKSGFSPRGGQEAPRVTSALSLVAAGLGVAVVPASMQQMIMNGVVYRDLTGSAQPKSVLYLLSRRGDTSIVVRNFVSLVKRTSRELTEG